MGVKENRDIVRRFHDEVIVGQNFALVPELMHDEMEHARGAIGETISAMAPDRVKTLRSLKGHERFIAGTKLLRSLFPEWHSTLEEMVAERDKVVTKCTVRGRDTGGFLGQGPRQGAAFVLEQVIIHKLKDGKIKKVYAMSDQLGFWRALGAELPGEGDQISQSRRD